MYWRTASLAFAKGVLIRPKLIVLTGHQPHADAAVGTVLHVITLQAVYLAMFSLKVSWLCSIALSVILSSLIVGLVSVDLLPVSACID